MNEGRAVINERINLTKQAQASNQLKIWQDDFFFFPSRGANSAGMGWSTMFSLFHSEEKKYTKVFKNVSGGKKKHTCALI